jgi:ribosomal protein S18 acetylase RimI-like enzyme
MMAQLYAQDRIPFNADRARAALLALMDEPRFGFAWIIELALEPAGYVIVTLGYSLEYGGQDAFVDELFVLPDYRGRGAGSTAVEFAADHCRTVGVHAIHLEVDHDNPRAQALYRRLGFNEHERYLMTRWL